MLCGAQIDDGAEAANDVRLWMLPPLTWAAAINGGPFFRLSAMPVLKARLKDRLVGEAAGRRSPPIIKPASQR